jgi:chromosome partitioning protein
MPKIICIASQKGGVGKSTLCYNLACMFKNGLEVAVLDLDLQSSISDLLGEQAGVHLIPPTVEAKHLQEVPYDLLFIDTPPYLSGKLLEILSIADVVLVPTKAGVFDALALKDTIQLIEKAKLRNAYLNAAIVFTMVKPGTKLLAEIKSVIHTGAIKVMDKHITERVSYSRSLLEGGVLESKDSKAKLEMMELTDELVKLLGL